MQEEVSICICYINCHSSDLIRKTKCSGHPPPCQMCEQLDTPCIIDLTLDMRRRTALQRTLEESRAFQDTLHTVFGVLRKGGKTVVQDLISHIKLNNADDDLVEDIQAKFHEWRETDNRSQNVSIKEEDDDALNFDTDEEGSQSKQFYDSSPQSLQGRTFSGLDGDISMSGPNTPQADESTHQINQMGARYLSLISRLRSVSDLEATRILHDFRTSPVTSEDAASMHLLDQRQARPHLNLHTAQYLAPSASKHLFSTDRSTWHPSLQINRSELPTPIPSSAAPGWSDPSHSHSIQVCLQLHL